MLNCNKCGYQNDTNSNFCINCGNQLNNQTLKEQKLKCSKCGYPNEVTQTNCKNCEYPLNDTNLISGQVDNNLGKMENTNYNKTKNIILFIVFGILFGIILPVFLIFGSYLIETTTGQEIAPIILLGVGFFLSAEFLTCFITKKIVKNTYLLDKCLVIYVGIGLLFFGYFSIISPKSWVLILVLIVLKILSWFITRKLVIKDRIKFNKKSLIAVVSYVVLILLYCSISAPTSLNKKLFMLFGNTEFSSKETYAEIIEEYNMNSEDDYNYFHTLTHNELNEVKEIYIHDSFSNSDLAKLKGLTYLVIFEEGTTDEHLDFSNNTNLREISIFTDTVKSIKLSENNTSLQSLNIDSIMNELDLTSLNYIEEIDVKAKTIKINNINELRTGNKYIEFNKLLIGNNQVLSIKNDNYIYYNGYEIGLPKYTKVSDLVTTNLKVKVSSKYNGDLDLNDEITDYYDQRLYLYDNNNNLLLNGEIYIRRD